MAVDAENPAIRSPLVQSLYRSGVVAAQLRGPGDPALLLPEERVGQERWATKRVAEFAAGRLCARCSIEALGVPAQPVLRATDRRPLWPEGILGSITHADGFCAAAVCFSMGRRSIGLDVEVVGRVTPDMWRLTCTPEEIARLENSPLDERDRLASLIFSAKEAFYKCQYVISQQWIGFQDVSVAPAGELAQAGRLILNTSDEKPLPLGLAQSARVRYRFVGPWVLVGVEL